jgi:hypothetical protein
MIRVLLDRRPLSLGLAKQLSVRVDQLGPGVRRRV